MTSPIPDPRLLAPIVILVRPQMGENIGAVARAMSNFGLSELRLAAPRDGWPNPKALEMAAGAEAIIRNARVYPDFTAALGDIQLAYATTARPRDMEKRVLTAAAAMEEIMGMSGVGCQVSDKNIDSDTRHPTPVTRIALVFGPERSGLENDEVTLCDTLITIPTAPENSSLNIAQSAVILGYEWFKQDSGFGIRDSGKDKKCVLPESLATGEEWSGLFGQLESYLDAANYFRVDHKKPAMWQNMQNMLLRARWSSQELRTFRGMLRSLWERRA